MVKGCIIKGQLKFQAWITMGLLSLVNSDRNVKIYVCFALKFNSGRDGKKPFFGRLRLEVQISFTIEYPTGNRKLEL